MVQREKRAGPMELFQAEGCTLNVDHELKSLFVIFPQNEWGDLGLRIVD